MGLLLREAIGEMTLLVEHLRHRDVMPDDFKAVVGVLIVTWILNWQGVLMLICSGMRHWRRHKLGLVVRAVGAAVTDNYVIQVLQVIVIFVIEVDEGGEISLVLLGVVEGLAHEHLRREVREGGGRT